MVTAGKLPFEVNVDWVPPTDESPPPPPLPPKMSYSSESGPVDHDAHKVAYNIIL